MPRCCRPSIEALEPRRSARIDWTGVAMIFVMLLSLAVALFVILRDQNPQIRTTVPPPDSKRPDRIIPLEQCYSTFESKPVQVLADDFSPALLQIVRETRRRAPDLFLVRTGPNDIRLAIALARDVLLGHEAADGAVRDSSRTEKDAPVWLVCDLGIVGGPPIKRVTEISLTGKHVRLVISPRRTSDRYQTRHLVWVPLGQLPEGTYILELSEEGETEPWLSRQVKVQE